MTLRPFFSFKSRNRRAGRTARRLTGHRHAPSVEVLQERLLLADATFSFTEPDADIATFRLTGTGTLTLSDPDSNGVPQLDIADTDVSSKLKISVKRARSGNGSVLLDGIAGTGLKSLSAKAIDLGGSGMNLTGSLGELSLHDIQNGADIAATGSPTERISISAHVVGDGTTIDVGTAVRRMTVASFGDGAILAPSIGSISVTGDKSLGIAGDFGGDITLSASGLPMGKPVLRTVKIGGTASDITVDVAGDIRSFTTGRLVNGRIFAGYVPEDPNAALRSGTFTATGQITSFQATGIKGRSDTAFASSTIAADVIGSVTLASVAADNAGHLFGVIGNSVGAVTATSPRFHFNAANATPQGIGDFVVLRAVKAPTIIGFSDDTGVVGDQMTNDVTPRITGIADPNSIVTVFFNGTNHGTTTVDTAGTWSFTPNILAPETYSVTTTSRDAASNSSVPSANLVVIIDTAAPMIEIFGPTSGLVTAQNITITGVAADDRSGLQSIEASVDSSSFFPLLLDAAGQFSLQTSLQLDGSADGDHTVRLRATDRTGNTSNPVSVKFTLDVSANPPGKDFVAPPLDTSVVTTLAAATEFLYTGSNPIQQGVAAGTIEPTRIAVLRGRVLDREGNVLPDVTISVAHHADFGSTHTRADGMFDMAVNGGRVLTIVYTKEGFLPAERQVDAPWQDYAWLPDVRLVTLDPQVTMIDLTAAIPEQVARGSVVTDEDGIRQATLLFTQGTNASMVFADGSSQPLTTLHVRATEYTVGPDGPEAMPAALPPASGYTYAVELSADEAIAAGATRVAFDRPVSFYVENFLNFPVGGGVPSGFYDRQQNVWVPSQNGRIVQIIAMTSGLAEVDVDGDGTADADSKLSPLGITNAELQRLGDLYQVGQSLWRIPITHFTPYDWNWPYGPPAGATSPNQPAAPNPRPESNSCEVSGSICEVQSQILREAVSVVGTPFSLNYSSNVAGRIANRSLNIPLSGDSVPASLAGIQLEVTVAGQRFRRGFSGAPNQTFTFTWDGQDAYGRSVQGTQVATVRIGYVYGAVYLGIGAFESSFGALSSSGTALTVNLARQDVTYWQQYEAQLSKRDVLQEGLGGWLLDVHHTYDPVGRVLHLGDGSRRSTASISDVIMTVAGGGSQPDAEGIRATDATIRAPRGLAADAQGNLFIAEPADDRVRKVSTDGIITTVANLGITSLSTALAIDVHGNLYVPGDFKVIKIAPDGTITTVAGTGVSGFSGDGGPATSAQITNPWGLAVDAQGNLFISDQGNHRIRKVSPDGIINTLAGNGQFASNGDGGPAINASFRFPGGLAVDQRGNLYIAENLGHRVRKVSSDGIISTVAGTGVRGFGGDGGPANSAALNIPSALAVDRLGNLYIADSGNFRIRVVDQTGVIYTLAGDGTRDSKGNGVLATAEGIGENVSVAVDSEENVYVTGISQTLKDVVRKISQPLPGFNNLDLAIASEDGTQLYRFDPSGRHLQTLHTLTGATLLSFDYNSAGHLTSVTDVDNNITHIERNSDGDPMAIVAPFGQRTTLGLDANGYVSSIANPANEANNYTYTPDGLMTTFTDPRNGVHRFSYDALARLARDEDPAGGFKTFSRTETEQGFQVTVTTAENRVSTYLVELLPTGSGHRVNTGPDGLSTDHVIRRDGTETITNPDGTIINLTMHPDPRWGMQAPFASALMVTTPGGLRTSLTATRTVTNGSGLSLGILTHAVTFNGNLYTSVFDALTRQITNTTPEGRQTVTVLDAAGRLSAGEIGGVVPFGLTYDAQGRPVSFTLLPGPEAKVETFGYDTQGALVSITGADLRASNYEYDAAGRLTRQVFPDTREITLARNANGNVTRVTPPGQPGHAFEYSAVGLMEMYTPPGGESTGDTLYAYDRDRNRVQIRRPEGTIITAGYNAAGDVEMLTLPNGETQFGYDPGTGQLTTITRHNGDTLSYDFDNTLIMQTTWGGTVSGGVSRTYDNSFRLASESINDAHNVTFRYDRDGLLTQAGSFTINRDAQTGLVIGTALGGVVTATAFDRFADVETATANVNGTDMFAVRYDRDAVSRITRRTETVGGTTDAYDYDYDDAGRLAHVRRNGTFIAGYTYDHNGNRLTATGPGGTALGSYDAQDRLIQYGDTTYVYSPNGTLRSQTTGSQTTIYDYDELGNLVAVSLPDGRRIEYVVDGNNRRVGKRIEGTLIQGFLYGDQLRPRAELDGNSNVVSRFVYATKVNVPVYMEKGGNTYRILSDHLGSPRLVLDVTTGAVVQRMDYDEFGNVVLDTNPGFQPFGFAGGLYDSDTALIRFGSRDYDPRVGRWTSKDALLFGGGSTNLYAYVTNDPINSVDLTGTVNIGLGFLGGVIGAGSNLLSAYINGKSGTDLAVAAGVGFGAGFIGGLIPYPPLSGAVTGGITKAGNIAVGLDCSENPSWDILKEALIGGVLGGIAGAGGRALGEASAPSIAAAEGLGEIGSQLGGVIGGSAATIVQSLPLPGL